VDRGRELTPPHPDSEYPADPYPGVAPGFSFVHLDAASHPVQADAAARGGWTVATAGPAGSGGEGIDSWLAAHGGEAMAARVPVLTFGSNHCPTKITWLRDHLGLTGPVVVLRAEVRGVVAVWAAGLRARDGARPATLALSDRGHTETHAVWMATPAQVAVLDVCEGRGERYHLVRLHAARIRTDDAAALDDPWTYWPVDGRRAPLLVDGVPVRCAEVGQQDARDLVGTPAPLPARAVTPVAGAPEPDTWPRRVFVYGTLRPGRSAWWRLAPHAVTTEPAGCAGQVHETGRGYPALVPGPGRAVGTVVTLADPAAALPGLDAYEGPEYRRARGVAYLDSTSASPEAPTRSSEGGDGRGTPCWMWVWDSPVPDGPAGGNPWR